MNGYGELKGKTFRMAPMGWVTEKQTLAMLDAATEALQLQLNAPVAPYRVLIADKFAQEGLDVFATDPDFVIDVNINHTKEDLLPIMDRSNAIIVRSATTLDKDLIDAASKLQVVTRAGSGYDNIDVAACTEKGIKVLITPGGNVTAVVELTLGLMLDAARKITFANTALRQNNWAKSNGIEIKGKTLGIMGLGRIGGEVAKRAQTFGMRVIAYDKYIPPARAGRKWE